MIAIHFDTKRRRKRIGISTNPNQSKELIIIKLFDD